MVQLFVYLSAIKCMFIIGLLKSSSQIWFRNQVYKLLAIQEHCCALNRKMEWTTYLFLVIISVVRGEFTSNFMVRNSSYDNKAFLASKLISTSHYRSVFDCAADCAKNHECKSTTFNADTHICQLLSAHKEAISNTTTKKTTGWVYFEKLITTCRYMHISTQIFVVDKLELTSQCFFVT